LPRKTAIRSGNQKRQPEAAIRSGNQKRQKEAARKIREGREGEKTQFSHMG
jgi:hypothetical protein